MSLIVPLVRKPVVARSPKWPKFRLRFLYGRTCAACGGKELLEAHHIKPFHLFPDLELDENNVLPLCERKRSGLNCHLLIGHLGNYRSYNETAKQDAAYWLQRLKSRPYK